jgi:hypothetical protein
MTSIAGFIRLRTIAARSWNGFEQGSADEREGADALYADHFTSPNSSALRLTSSTVPAHCETENPGDHGFQPIALGNEARRAGRMGQEEAPQAH